MIIRKTYIDRILPFIDKNIIKVLIGVRRSGKTIILKQLMDVVKKRNDIDNEQIIYINFESISNSKLSNYEELYSFILQKKSLYNKKLYIFLDEIQHVNLWERVLSSLLVDIECDIYITGSNSKLLSSELATNIAGRYVHFNIYPFSFKEIKELFEAKGALTNNEALFQTYLKYGGLPQTYQFDDDESKRTYISDIFDTIVLNDIITRGKVKDVYLLKKIVTFLLDNIGNPFSLNKMTNTLKSNGVPTTVSTVSNYIEEILKAIILINTLRYDVKGKEILSTNEKYYAIDLGLRNVIKSSDITDFSKLFENVVFLELLKRGYSVNVGKLNDLEVDFVAVKNGNKEYYQITYLMSDEKTIEREFRSLLMIDDNYPKYVISADTFDFTRDGIIHKNIIDFLLEQ